jgi:hypothetical protein
MTDKNFIIPQEREREKEREREREKALTNQQIGRYVFPHTGKTYLYRETRKFAVERGEREL